MCKNLSDFQFLSIIISIHVIIILSVIFLDINLTPKYIPITGIINSYSIQDLSTEFCGINCLYPKPDSNLTCFNNNISCFSYFTKTNIFVKYNNSVGSTEIGLYYILLRYHSYVELLAYLAIDYPINKTVNIYYNPNNPGFLYPTDPNHFDSSIIIIIIACSIILVFIIYVIRTIIFKKQQSKILEKTEIKSDIDF